MAEVIEFIMLQYSKVSGWQDFSGMRLPSMQSLGRRCDQQGQRDVAHRRLRRGCWPWRACTSRWVSAAASSARCAGMLARCAGLRSECMTQRPHRQGEACMGQRKCGLCGLRTCGTSLPLVLPCLRNGAAFALAVACRLSQSHQLRAQRPTSALHCITTAKVRFKLLHAFRAL